MFFVLLRRNSRTSFFVVFVTGVNACALLVRRTRYGRRFRHTFFERGTATFRRRPLKLEKTLAFAPAAVIKLSQVRQL